MKRVEFVRKLLIVLVTLILVAAASIALFNTSKDVVSAEVDLIFEVGELMLSNNLHSMAIAEDGSLWGWGDNHYGAVGNGTNFNEPNLNTSTLFYMPRFLFADVDLSLHAEPLPINIKDGVVYVSAGSSHTMAITKDGKLWGWGNNWNSQVSGGSETESIIPIYLYINGRTVYGGTRESEPVISTPVHIKDNVAHVAAGRTHTMAVTDDGRLWGWGNNWAGVLGDGTDENRYSPVYIKSNVVFVSTSSSHTMAITKDGSLWGWGSNFSGELGDGTTTRQYSPIHIMDNVVYVSAGPGYTMAITEDRRLWGWGHNWTGVLGDGTTRNRRRPIHIMDNIVYVSAGPVHVMAITSDGALWGWGANDLGELGSGSRRRMQRRPIHIKNNVISVSAGSGYTTAITADGNLWAWGFNRGGQLGDGTLTNRHRPVLIMSLQADVE